MRTKALSELVKKLGQAPRGNANSQEKRGLGSEPVPFFRKLSLLVLVFVASSFHAAGGEEKPVSFNNDVMPLLDKLGCNATSCHGSAKGQGGFQLSMFAAGPDRDYLALTKSDAARRINPVEPIKSLCLLKATESVKHGGGKRIQPGSAEYKMLASWIAQGTPRAVENEPALVSLKATPEKQVLKKDAAVQLAVTAVYSDGAEKVVTADARYRSSQEAVAKAAAKGTVKAGGFGQSTIVVTYMRRAATVRVVVPQPLPNPFPEVKPNNKIDELVLAKLKELGIPPSDLCSDHQFLRRVYLDTTGMLPTAEQARAFLADADPQKRSKLIDRLLGSEQFADFWALKWGDLLRMKSEYPSNLWPNAVQAYHRWVRDSIVSNKPFDQFARELITSSGSNFRDPQANYYRAFLKREPQSFADATALVFMGARLGCARCHGHPVENWSLDDNLGMAAFFVQVKFKKTQEWKEEIVYTSPKSTLRHPVTKQLVPPKFPGGAVPEIKKNEDPREKFAQWLTAPDNPYFAPAIANRTWFWLLGRGIVHDVDDMRPTNPPENPELLAYLTQELITHKYDLKHLYRLILNSRTYQLSSKSNQFNQHDKAHFSRYYVKRLGAETLLDAIGQVTETTETFTSRIPEPFIRTPKDFKATHLADGSIGVPFLQLFGRPPRDTAYESDRDLETSMRQVLHLLNSSHVQGKINASPRLKRYFTQKKPDAEILEEVYLSTLSRLPTDEEKKKALEYIGKDPKLRTQAIQDLVWAMFNTKEFVFNH